MDEIGFWHALEFRVCREIDGLGVRTLRGWWCDGFIAEDLDAARGQVRGQVWMGKGPRHQEAWDFVLLLGAHSPDREAVDWGALLPPESATGWLAIDPDRKWMLIEPARGFPDSAS